MNQLIAEKVVSRILTEDMLTIAEAQEEHEKVTGYPVDRSTINRWINRGFGETRLDAARIGKKLYTSSQALHRFIAARTAQSVGNQ